MKFWVPFFSFLVSFFLFAWGLRALASTLHEGHGWHDVWAYGLSIVIFCLVYSAFFKEWVDNANDPETTPEQRGVSAIALTASMLGTILGCIFLANAVDLIVTAWSRIAS